MGDEKTIEDLEKMGKLGEKTPVVTESEIRAAKIATSTAAGQSKI
jgi:hypothetical protein